MSAQSDMIAAEIERHADLILRASGSGLRHYTMPATRNAILSAVIDCYEQAYRAGINKPDVSEANARLIAAAPDLLEALQEAEKHFGPFAEITINGQHDSDDVRVVALMRAAISRALGEGEKA